RTSYDLGRLASGHSGWRGAAAGMAGVAQAGGDTLRRMAGRPFASVGNAYRRGSEAAFAATGGTMSAASGDAPSTGSASPAWARRLRTEQRLQHAGAITVHALKDGDRGMAGDNPKLRNEED
ncbi:MAG: P-type conjugative transfer protein TrbL, partial [Henriciella sp.]